MHQKHNPNRGLVGVEVELEVLGHLEGAEVVEDRQTMALVAEEVHLTMVKVVVEVHLRMVKEVVEVHSRPVKEGEGVHLMMVKVVEEVRWKLAAAEAAEERLQQALGVQSLSLEAGELVDWTLEVEEAQHLVSLVEAVEEECLLAERNEHCHCPEQVVEEEPVLD